MTNFESSFCGSTLPQSNSLLCCALWIFWRFQARNSGRVRFVVHNSVPLRSLVVLHQSMKSVPEFLGISGVWCAVLNTCVGGIQGVLGGLVLPAVAKRLSGDRLSFLLTMGIMTSCLLPAAVITFLDIHCLGRWSECWDPCRNSPEQFNRVMKDGVIEVPLMRSADICDSYQVISQETTNTWKSRVQEDIRVR